MGYTGQIAKRHAIRFILQPTALFAAGCTALPDWHREDRTSIVELHETQPGLYPEGSLPEIWRCSETEVPRMLQAVATIDRIDNVPGKYEYHPRNTPLPLADSESQGILAALADIRNYRDRTTCDFTPALRITAVGTFGTTAVDVCFSCSDILLIHNESSGRKPGRHAMMFGMSHALRLSMLRLAKSHFPHDPELKRLYYHIPDS